MPMTLNCSTFSEKATSSFSYTRKSECQWPPHVWILWHVHNAFNCPCLPFYIDFGRLCTLLKFLEWIHSKIAFPYTFRLLETALETFVFCSDRRTAATRGEGRKKKNPQKTENNWPWLSEWSRGDKLFSRGRKCTVHLAAPRRIAHW